MKNFKRFFNESSHVKSPPEAAELDGPLGELIPKFKIGDVVKIVTREGEGPFFARISAYNPQHSHHYIIYTVWPHPKAMNARRWGFFDTEMELLSPDNQNAGKIVDILDI